VKYLGDFDLKDLNELKVERSPRLKLSAQESLKRTKEFDNRKEQFVATVRSARIDECTLIP
jgi:hypothetical protein